MNFKVGKQALKKFYSIFYSNRIQIQVTHNSVVSPSKLYKLRLTVGTAKTSGKNND